MITRDYLTKCYADLQKEGIWNDDIEVFKKNFLRWSLKNHPDKNLGNDEITKLYQVIAGCRNDFLENFQQYSSIAKNQNIDNTPQPQFYNPLEEIPCPICQKNVQRWRMGDHMRSEHPKTKPVPKRKSKKSKKSAPKKTKKSKKSAPKKTKKSKKAKKSKTKSKKHKKSGPKKTKKSGPKKSKKSAPKKTKKSKKSKKSKRSKKSKKSKKSKSKKAKKTKSVPKKVKKSKKSKSKKPKKSKTKSKKQKGGVGKQATNPHEFKKKMKNRVKKPSPLRNEIKPERQLIIKLKHKRTNSEPTKKTPEWDF